jgi:flagellin
MAMSVNTNIGSLSAMAASNANTKAFETSMNRLATGKRINSAADDAAGSAIASRLSSEITGTKMAIRNSLDAQALINTAEGSHAEVVNILQRMRELAVQGSSDTNNTDDRVNIQTELDALSTELDRIGSVTSWAGQLLLNGDATAAGSVSTTANETKDFTFQIGQGTSTADQLTVEISALDTISLALGTAGAAIGDYTASAVVAVTTDANSYAGTVSTTPFTSTVASTAAVTMAAETATTVAAATVVMSVGSTTFTMTTTLNTAYTATEMGDLMVSAFDAAKSSSANSAAGIQNYTAANASGVVTFTYTAAATAAGTAATALSVTSATTANAAVDLIDAALVTVSGYQSDLGSISNRLDHTVSNLTNIASNLEASKGRVEDADFAAESTNLARSQILSQAATAMLAQANASKQGVLQLLQR